MKQRIPDLGSILVGARAALLAAALCASATGLARAAELRSLAWRPGSTARPVLRIGVKGSASYRLESLEKGLRLRLSFPASTMSGSVSALGALGGVKGVFPYVAADGTSVNVDVLLSQPGGLEVQKTGYGYRALVQSAPAPALAPSAPAARTLASGAAPAANAIKDIVYARLPGDRLQLTLRMAAPPHAPYAFTVLKPARIALDFPNTTVATDKRALTVNLGALESITTLQGSHRARVVLSLMRPVGYTTAVAGNDFVLTLDALPNGAAGATPAVTHFAGSRPNAKYGITSVDFHRGPGGEGRIVIGLSDPSVGVDMRERAGQILVDFRNTSLPARLVRRLDVTDFATPVQTVDAFERGRSARVVINPEGKYEESAYQAGDVFTVSVKPVVATAQAKKTGVIGYTGEKLSLNFQNIDVRAALDVLADFTGLNFVVSDSVKGNLTLRLKDVPWDQALDIICNAKDLTHQQQGNVITVAPTAEVAAKEKAALEASQAQVSLEPLVSEVIRIDYAKAEDIANLLKSIKPVAGASAANVNPAFGGVGSGTTRAPSTESNTLLSPRGQVTVDERTNSILVQDTPEKIAQIRKLIAKLDQPVRQVLIEARLVQANANFAQSLGARLGSIYDSTNINGTRVITTGQESSVNTTYLTTGLPAAYNQTGQYNVNLPSPGIGNFAAGVFSVFVSHGSKLIDLELSALEQTDQGKIISSPRIVTANHKEASIEQGEEQVFTQNILGVGSVVTKKATLKLDVTPQITPDDRVNLDVDITKDSFIDPVAGTLSIEEVKTQALLDNGETVVIGGIYENDKDTTVTKIPLLGDLPLLGVLFRETEVKNTRTELLVFLTPRILAHDIAMR